MPKVRGRVLVFLDGFLVWETRNILTNKYQEAHMNWLLGKNPDLVNYIAVGMDDTTPTSTDRSLYNERHRREISLKLTRGGYIARYNATWPSTEPPAMEAAISLKEVGLFDKGPITIQNYSLEDWSAGAAAAPDNWTLVGSLIDVSKLDGQVLNIVWEVFAATSEEEVEVAKTAFAKEELTVSSTVVALTSSVYRPTGQTAASKAFITVEDNPIRYWYDGSEPTPTSGHLANAGDKIELEPLEDIENFKCIRATTADAAIKVTYER